jgi:hypothetical protein
MEENGGGRSRRRSGCLSVRGLRNEIETMPRSRHFTPFNGSPDELFALIVMAHTAAPLELVNALVRLYGEGWLRADLDSDRTPFFYRPPESN